MMWIRKELVTVFALVLVTVRATELCDVTKMQMFDVSALTGTMYLALTTENSTEEFEVGYGVNLTLKTNNGKPGLEVLPFRFYKSGSEERCIEGDLVLCTVISKGCQTNSNLTMYIIAHDENYVAMYSAQYRNIRLSTNVEIYIRDFSWNTRMRFRDLSRNLRDKIGQVCGEAATMAGFYPKHFEPGNFISDTDCI